MPNHPAGHRPAPALPCDDETVGPPTQSLQSLLPKSIRRPATNHLYLLSLWLVTLFCVLIPVIYVGLIGAIGWLEYQYYTGWAPGFHGGRALIGRLLVWVAPGFIGSVLILFLLKPLFAPRQKPPRAAPLQKGEEPAFTAAMHALCRSVGIRPPAEICLSHQVNAWVQFDGGILGFLRGRKLLTVGLPLVASMNSRQLVGVLAHEFGHFAQGGAMRCAHVINNVNRWLHSRAYDHDEWDDRLERWTSEDSGGYVRLVAWLTSLCLWLTRGFMRSLFQLSFRLSRRLSQQMEFDADRYEATLAGSECFRATAMQLRALARAYRDTDRINAAAWREGKLVDDLPAAIEARLKRLDSREWKQIADDLEGDHETQYWSSHPADQERIANVEQLASPGLFLDERPARLLFDDFPALARRVTAHYYEEMDLSFGPRNLIDVQQLWKLNRLDDGLSQTWTRYSNGMIGDALLVSPAEAKLLPASNFDWQGTVDELRRLAPDTTGLWQRLAKRRERADELALWIALIDLDMNFVMPNGAMPDNAALREEFGTCTAEDSADYRLAQRVLALFARRLHHAIEALPESDHGAAAQRLALLQCMHDLWPKMKQLAQSRIVLLRLYAGMSASNDRLRQWAYQRASDYRDELSKLLEKMDGVALDELSLGKQLRNRCGHLSQAGDDPFQYLQGTAPLEDAFLHIYRSTLAELAVQADQSESEKGIRPIRLVPVRAPVSMPA